MGQKKTSFEINYVYFGIYFFLLTLLSACSVLIKQNLSGSRIFFFLYAMGQAAIETAILLILSIVIVKYLPKIFFYLFIGATFLLLTLHILDFLMDQILDMSIWETIGFVLDEDFTNFLYLLDASGISLWIWGMIFASFALLPFLGIFFYRLSESITKKRPFRIQTEKFLLIFFCIPSALLFWDFNASSVIHPDSYTAFLQSLPWKFTFLEPKTTNIPLPSHLRRAPTQETVLKEIALDQTSLSEKPNIYLFIIESLRGDIITKEIAPNLHSFSQESVPLDYSLSNANGTMLSWYAIFHSQFAYHWQGLKDRQWEMGSPSLNLLKKWGYQIRVYTSAQLGYYGMESLIFGKNAQLIDSYQTFHHAPPVNAADTDAETIQALRKDLSENPQLNQGQVFIVFWDATHFDYSWPKNWTPKFIPFSNEFAYFQAFYSRDKIELIKNRYRNAVNFSDHLFGKFMEDLPEKDNAVIIVTGDHGEEFFEQGHLFHNSHLVKEQTQVPLYMKFGKAKSKSKRKIASHMDIFPSIIDHLSGKTPQYLGGQSVLRDSEWPFVLSTRFNAGRTPYEFSIHNGQNKMIARFSNKKDIFKSKTLQIRSLRSADDKIHSHPKRSVQKWIEKEFGLAIDRLSD